MKLHLFKNDKSTFKDEVVFTLITLLVYAIGITLFITKPSFGIISSADTTCFGVLMIILGVMYTPCIIYRLLTNERK